MNKMRFMLAIVLMFCSILVVAHADDGVRIITGTVESINNGCAVDGACGFAVRTTDGIVNVIWNMGMVPPQVARACPIPAEVDAAAEKLKVGQKVEVHIPTASSNNMLCGNGAAIIVRE